MKRSVSVLLCLFISLVLVSLSTQQYLSPEDYQGVDAYSMPYVKKGRPQGPLRFGKRRGPSGPLRFGKRSGGVLDSLYEDEQPVLLY